MGSSPCCSKDSDLNRGSWTAKEDMILSEYVTIHGEGRWRSLPKKAGLKRCGKSCRLRWLNYLRPDIKRGNISQDEEELIIRLHRLLGNRWSLIAGRLPGRTDNEVKNYWNTKLSKRLADNEILTKSPTRQALVKSPPKAGDSVLKITPVKATAVRTAKSFSNKNSGGGYKSYHQDLWSRDDAETVKASKSWCELLVDDFITHKNSDFVDFPIMQKFASSGSPSMDIDAHSPTSVSNFVDRKPRRSQHSAPNEVNMSNGLIYLNDLRSPECELLLSPCNSPEDFEARSTTELEQMSCIDSNLQQLGSFSVGGEQAMVELEQHGDWVRELETLQKSSLGLLMLESEENWVERCYNLSL